MIRIKLIAMADNDNTLPFHEIEFLKIEFPERPKANDKIFFSDFISAIKDVSQKKIDFLEEGIFKIRDSAWRNDKQGVYLTIWCNAE